MAGFLAQGSVAVMAGIFRVRLVGMEDVGPAVDEKAEVVRHDTGERFETKPLQLRLRKDR